MAYSAKHYQRSPSQTIPKRQFCLLEVPRSKALKFPLTMIYHIGIGNESDVCITLAFLHKFDYRGAKIEGIKHTKGASWVSLLW
jgi:hypothetical protein